MKLIVNRKCMLTTATTIETPLGDLEVDIAAQQELNKTVENNSVSRFIEVVWFLSNER